MKRIGLLMIIAAACVAFSAAAYARVIKESPVAQSSAVTAVDAYEATAKELGAVPVQVKNAYASGQISAKAFADLKAQYAVARTAYLATGDRHKEYLRKPSPAAKARWTAAADKSTAQLKRLRVMLKKYKVEAPI